MSLNGRKCPACGGGKQRSHTLCRGCYFRLPVGSRAALYDRLGSGYAEAVGRAFELMGRAEFLMPD